MTHNSPHLPLEAAQTIVVQRPKVLRRNHLILSSADGAPIGEVHPEEGQFRRLMLGARKILLCGADGTALARITDPYNVIRDTYMIRLPDDTAVAKVGSKLSLIRSKYGVEIIHPECQRFGSRLHVQGSLLDRSFRITSADESFDLVEVSRDWKGVANTLLNQASFTITMKQHFTRIEQICFIAVVLVLDLSQLKRRAST